MKSSEPLSELSEIHHVPIPTPNRFQSLVYDDGEDGMKQVEETSYHC